MTKKSAILFGLLAVVMFLGNGCAAFRELFSDPGAEKRRTTRKAAVKKQNKSGYQSRRYSRDPLDSLFRTAPDKREDWSKNSNLTDAEKAALRNSLDPEEDATRQVIDQVYRDNERKRKKRQDDVFGPSPFRN